MLQKISLVFFTFLLDFLSKEEIYQSQKRKQPKKNKEMEVIILLIGHGRILLDGNLNTLKEHFAKDKKITVKYTGSTPVISTGMRLLESKENQMTISLDPHILPVSSAIALLASQTELLDVSVADISTEEVVAALYKEYHI